MRNSTDFEIFLASAPGLEQALWAEAREKGWKSARFVPGGVTMKGGWKDVWRANLEIRGANRVLARLGSFKAERIDELQARAKAFPWHRTLRRDVPVRVEATCTKSRIYHTGATEERISKAIHETLRAKIEDGENAVTIMARIEDNVCTLSVDTSGELLHKRGHKDAVNQAPIRETMAALFLRQCGYTGTEPVIDPMCGSGTFVIEAAEIAAGLPSGRQRQFAFEKLATFEPGVWAVLRAEVLAKVTTPNLRFHGSDRDEAAVAMAKANATNAGVAEITSFRKCVISEVTPPDGPPGLVIVNPPYGARLGDKGRLQSLYRSFGEVMRTRFQGWRVGLVTSEGWLAEAAALPFEPPGPPVNHGGLRVKLYRTGPLI